MMDCMCEAGAVSVLGMIMAFLIGATKIYHRNWVPKLMDFVDPYKNRILSSTLFRMLENIRLRPPGAGYHLASHEISSSLALTLL
jgi:hypothetical protein